MKHPCWCRDERKLNSFPPSPAHKASKAEMILKTEKLMWIKLMRPALKRRNEGGTIPQMEASLMKKEEEANFA